MCEPLTVAGLGMGALGSVTQIYAAGQRGRAAAAAGESNAQAAEAAARDAIERSLLPGARIRERGGRFLATQVAHQAASGAVIGAGSAGDVLAGTEGLSEEDAQVVALDAYREAYGLRSQARSFRQGGQNALAAAKNEQVGALIRLGGTAAMAGASWYAGLPKTGAVIPSDGPTPTTLGPDDDYFPPEQ